MVIIPIYDKEESLKKQKRFINNLSNCLENMELGTPKAKQKALESYNENMRELVKEVMANNRAKLFSI